MPLLEMQGLTKHYGTRRGVDDVTLNVDQGEVFGFLGPNGAGKTTTIRQVMGFLKPDAGRALVAGLDCWRESVAVKRLVGYLPSGMALDPGLTGGQLLEYFANLRGDVDQRYVGALAERFGLDLSRKFRQYSHGNKQKVGIVQAFMHKPPLLLLDEPTSGLDPLNQQEFARLVRETRDDGRTVFLSSHVLSEVEELCDRVAIIREGRLVHVGALGSLTTIHRQVVEIVFAEAVLRGEFAALPGVESAELLDQGRRVRLVVQGDMDSVVKLAAQYRVTRLVSQQPALEESFMRFYARDDAAEDLANGAETQRPAGVA
ncbi:MAG TPA: ABC transporter ATP-binding protein [Chloroflexota bacterium]|nr:ABC transporter ATP-binding protein [Chloroflexota bacterium]